MRKFLRRLLGGSSPEQGVVSVESSGKSVATVIKELVPVESIDCEFIQLATLIDDALRLMEAERVPIDDYGDVFNMQDRFVRQRVDGKNEEVSLIIDLPGIGDDPRFGHIFIPEQAGTVGPGILYGILTLNGNELKAPIGESLRTYTRQDFEQIIREAFRLVEGSYWPI